ncbi:MAG: ABC transporter ATP-binding protein [Bacilli bacterium]
MKKKNVILSSKNLTKEYMNGESSFKALDDVSFDIYEGELVVILGPSGAGKTTLLNLIGGMDNPSSGELFVDNENIVKFDKKQLALYRRNKVGFVFQFYNLMPNLTALENVELATELKKDSLSPEEVLLSLNLGDKMNNFPSQLSGGEQQRVSIARALAKNPKIILCDEPTGALDYNTGKLILGILQKMAKDNNQTVLIVTHNSALKDMGNKTIYIKNGRIENIQLNKKPMNIKDIVW